MIAYPLFLNLCGNENLSKIAIIDIAGVLFGFSVYMNLLEQVQDGKKSTVKDVCHSAMNRVLGSNTIRDIAVILLYVRTGDF